MSVADWIEMLCLIAIVVAFAPVILVASLIAAFAPPEDESA